MDTREVTPDSSSYVKLNGAGFWQKLWETLELMLRLNSQLKAAEGERRSYQWQWPLNYQGQPFCGTSPEETRVYLLGNPVIWWLDLVILIVTPVGFLTKLTIAKRASAFDTQEGLNMDRSVLWCMWLWSAWFVHFAPFLLMSRVLYFHHYFPAAFIAHILSGFVIGCVLDKISTCLLRVAVLGVLLAVLFQSFIEFSPLSYGMNGAMASDRNSPYAKLKWLKSWDF